MQLAILADIHGNSRALEAVLEDAHRRGLTEFVDLGDILSGPLEPRKTFDMLKQVRLVAQVSGNQDRAIVEASHPAPTRDFLKADLGPELIEWLSKLPLTALVADEILLCHGSPASDTTYLLEDVASGRPQVRPDADILADLGEAAQWPVILCGHTHVPRVVQLENGPLLLNPGSIGLPAYDHDAPVPHFMETFSPHASYAVLEKTKRGWSASFHRIPYDHHGAAARARDLNRLDWAQGIEFGRMK